jgi:hypothetical protein
MTLDSLDEWLQSWESANAAAAAAQNIEADTAPNAPDMKVAITIPALRKLIDDAKRMRDALNLVGEKALAGVPSNPELCAALMSLASEAVDGV